MILFKCNSFQVTLEALLMNCYLYTMRYSIFLVIWLWSCTSSTQPADKPVTDNPGVSLEGRTHGVLGDSAMVVCAHPIAAQVGADILRKGGNAVDAAVAVQFALAVVYPNAGNIGGGGFMVMRSQDGSTSALDFREKAPSASDRDMFINKQTGEVDRKKIETSHLASGVPGSVAGMWEAHQKYGTLPWADLIQPAIDLAENGFPVTKNQADDLRGLQRELKSLNPGKNYFLKNDWKEGDLLIQQDLANTFIAIRDNGRDGFYSGEVAKKIVAEMSSHNGIISGDDLKNYQAVWRTPVQGTYRGYTIISMPPPSSGGVALMQLLNMMEPFPLSDWGFHTTATMSIMVEAEKRVYADRATWLGDPDFAKVPTTELTAKSYAAQRMLGVDTNTVTPSKNIKAGNIPGYESEETTHFSIVDQFGNAVAITTTLNDSYGSRIVVAGCGFILNNEMDDFSAKPGEPNLYGLIGGEANAIAPNKRMLSSMTPTIVLKDNKLFMVIGSPGGSTIITSVFQNIVNVIDFNMTMQESVNASRFHHQWLPDEIKSETSMDEVVLQKLKAKGYTLSSREAIGRVDAILIHEGSLFEGAPDPRGDDAAVGW